MIAIGFLMNMFSHVDAQDWCRATTTTSCVFDSAGGSVTLSTAVSTISFGVGSGFGGSYQDLPEFAFSPAIDTSQDTDPTFNNGGGMNSYTATYSNSQAMIALGHWSNIGGFNLMSAATCMVGSQSAGITVVSTPCSMTGGVGFSFEGAVLLFPGGNTVSFSIASSGTSGFSFLEDDGFATGDPHILGFNGQSFDYNKDGHVLILDTGLTHVGGVISKAKGFEIHVFTKVTVMTNNSTDHLSCELQNHSFKEIKTADAIVTLTKRESGHICHIDVEVTPLHSVLSWKGLLSRKQNHGVVWNNHVRANGTANAE